MAYRKEKHKVLSGSLNYLAPGDLLDDEALALTNFRSDQLGSIRSRFGSSLVNTAGGAAIRSLIKALGIRYQGSTALYRAFSSVATGFDGEPIGLASWKKYLWAMNRSKQVKDNGTSNYNWAITAPASACTAAAGSEYTTTVSTFDNSETFVVDPTGDNSFDGSEKQEGTSSLSFTVPDDETYSITRTVSLNLNSIGGQTAGDDDIHRIWIFCNKFKKLQEVTILIDANAGDFKSDYYTATITRKMLKKAGKGWKRFEIRKRKLLDADLREIEDPKKHPFFERTGSTANKDWSTIAAIKIILDTRAACTVKFDHWAVYGSTAAEIESNELQYYFTYVNDDGHESNPSPASAKIAVNRKSVSITGLTASADAQVAGKYLYRTSPELEGRVYRVNSSPIANATTTYTDTSSDKTISALGFQMETDNDAPPAARGLIGPYLGRLIAYASSSNKARFWWSKLNKPYAWPGAALDAGNFQDIGDTGEEIIGATMRTQMILFYKENSIWRLTGDPDDIGGDVQVTRAQQGLIGNRAVVMAGDFDYFQGKEGVYRFNGDTAELITQKLDPIFKGQTVTLASGRTVAAVSAANRDKSCLEYINGRVYYSYCEEGQSTPNKTLVYNTAVGVWVSLDRGYSALYYEGQNGSFLGGRSDGAVHQLETGATDPSANITVDYQSRYHDQGIPDNEKTYEDLTLDLDTGGQDLTVTVYLNDGATTISLGTVNTTGRERRVLQLDLADGVIARNISVRVSGSTSAAVVIYDLVVNYYTEARQAKSFDTDETAFGTHKVKEVRAWKLDLDNAASAGLTHLSDQPSFAMASRDTATVALSTTRRLETVMLDEGIKGSLHRMRLSGSDFKLYALWALIKVIGTYLFGAKSEFYLSDVLDFGTERVKLIKEFEVVYSTTGTATFTVESDLPGSTLASRATPSLTATTGEETRKLRQAGTLLGRLFRIRITPTGDFQLEAIRALVKVIGAPNASPWTWIDLPVEASQDAIWQPVEIAVDEVG